MQIRKFRNRFQPTQRTQYHHQMLTFYKKIPVTAQQPLTPIFTQVTANYKLQKKNNTNIYKFGRMNIICKQIQNQINPTI